MLNISFKKKTGAPSHGVMFYWKLVVESEVPDPILDRFIPELFFDFFFIQSGQVCYVDKGSGGDVPLAGQTLKTIHTRPLTLALYPPLVLFGARFPIQFAESFWEPEMAANRFLDQNWVDPEVKEIDTFACQVRQTIRGQRHQKTAGPLLADSFEESDWLVHYSPRHKRRLYKSVFGISRKEMRAILGLHAFLGRTCDFASQNPRIIEHIDADVFYDQPHFNHLFKKMTDLSPLEYLLDTSILQDNLMAASYNGVGGQAGTMEP